MGKVVIPLTETPMDVSVKRWFPLSHTEKKKTMEAGELEVIVFFKDALNRGQSAPKAATPSDESLSSPTLGTSRERLVFLFNVRTHF